MQGLFGKSVQFSAAALPLPSSQDPPTVLTLHSPWLFPVSSVYVFDPHVTEIFAYWTRVRDTNEPGCRVSLHLACRLILRAAGASDEAENTAMRERAEMKRTFFMVGLSNGVAPTSGSLRGFISFRRVLAAAQSIDFRLKRMLQFDCV